MYVCTYIHAYIHTNIYIYKYVCIHKSLFSHCNQKLIYKNRKNTQPCDMNYATEKQPPGEMSWTFWLPWGEYPPWSQPSLKTTPTLFKAFVKPIGMIKNTVHKNWMGKIEPSWPGSKKVNFSCQLSKVLRDTPHITYRMRILQRRPFTFFSNKIFKRKGPQKLPWPIHMTSFELWELTNPPGSKI